MNGAINGFVKGAAIELENGVRINAVGPDIVEESPAYFSYFPGHIPVTMSRVTQAYIKSVLGGHNPSGGHYPGGIFAYATFLETIRDRHWLDHH
jgi:NAD(P)-dependent dehydrogenase (short-subunit alcohol dehydrogenase family)